MHLNEKLFKKAFKIGICHDKYDFLITTICTSIEIHFF